MFFHTGGDSTKVEAIRAAVIKHAGKAHAGVSEAYQDGKKIWKRIQAQGKLARKRMSIMLVAPEDPKFQASVGGKFILDLQGKKKVFSFPLQRRKFLMDIHTPKAGEPWPERVTGQNDRFTTLPHARRISLIEDGVKGRPRPQIILVLDKELVDQCWKKLPENTFLSPEQIELFDFDTIHEHPAFIFAQVDVGEQWYMEALSAHHRKVLTRSIAQRKSFQRGASHKFFGSGVGIGQRTVTGRVDNGCVVPIQ